MGWAEFILSFVGFFAAHNIPTRPAIRAALTRTLGARGFLVCYSLLSLLALYWLLMAAGRAPVVVLWPWAPWQSLGPILAMAVVSALLWFGVARPNPFSFGGRRNEDFDPVHPGVIRITRHPILAALALWAFAHILPNGNLAHVIVFGIFGAFALLGMRLIDRRKKTELPDWDLRRRDLRAAPLINHPISVRAGLLRAGGAVVLYVALLHLHGPLFGVSPLG